jgi:hypothetical protein
MYYPLGRVERPNKPKRLRFQGVILKGQTSKPDDPHAYMDVSR